MARRKLKAVEDHAKFKAWCDRNKYAPEDELLRLAKARDTPIAQKIAIHRLFLDKNLSSKKAIDVNVNEKKVLKVHIKTFTDSGSTQPKPPSLPSPLAPVIDVSEPRNPYDND